jgi:chromosome partitioning protein
MKTIVIAAQKGGAGKTTLACNLVIAASHDGRNVLCLNLAPQGSLRAWWGSWDAYASSMFDRHPAPEWLAEALGAADRGLIPVCSSPDDLRAVGATNAAINAARVPFAFALSPPPCQDHRRSRPRSGATWPGKGLDMDSSSRVG